MADPTDQTAASTDVSDQDGTASDDTLGDAGKRALDAERKARRTAERELEQLRKQSMTDTEKAIADARREAAADALKGVNKRLVAAEVRAAAAGKLANPQLASRLIDCDQFTVADDGTVDAKAVASAIEALLKSEPYLAAGARPAPLPGGSATPSTGLDMNSIIRRAAGRS
jgi:hypothetical protein